MRTTILFPTIVAALALAACNPVTESESDVKTNRLAVVGNIQPGAIQIDGPAAAAPGADLYANVGTPLNTGATLDWVLNSTANAGTDCLGSDAIATCIEAGVTGAVDGVGHWNGVRIVDGIGSADQNIFLKGGKENDATTWLIGPGTVGSSKFDMVQAYLANNQTQLFFGMERAGNNGTTAFDFEFNQLAPMALPECAQDPLVPCRSVGDVLFTFEMQGSGGSGSATPYVFRWNGTIFVAESATGLYSSINNSTSTAGGPWGHVNSHGDWVLGNLERFQFAEAMAPLSLLPGVDPCGGEAWVQVRTRSSAVDTSDLKDTSKAFRFIFNSVVATATLTPSCDQGFHYAASAVTADGAPVVEGGCAWTFSDGTESTACSGFHAAAPGSYTGTVTVTAPSLAGCEAEDDSASVNVYAPVGVTASMTPTCTLSFSYGAVPSGGSGAANQSYLWSFTGGGVIPSTSTTASGTAAVDTGGLTYTGVVVITDARDGLSCTATDDASAVPYAPLELNLALRAAAPSCPGMTSDAVTYDATTGGGNGAYTITWYGPTCSGTACTVDPADATFCAAQTVYATLSDSSGLCPMVTSETESYGKVTTVTATDLP